MSTQKIEQQAELWLKILAAENSDELLNAAMKNVADNLSMMTGREIAVDPPVLKSIPLSELMEHGTESPEAETVGIYLLIEGDLEGQSLLIFGLTDALYLVDMLMGEEPGTTQEMDDVAQSAMAEIGNISLASFLNVLSDRTGHSILPSPPAVIIDMAASILAAVAANTAEFAADQLIILDTVFKDAGRVIQTKFWVIPNMETNIIQYFKTK